MEKLKTTAACVKKSEIWSHSPTVVPPCATNWLFDASMPARFQTASPKKIKHKLKKDHLAKKCAHQEGPTREFWTSESTRRFQGPNILLKCASFECDCLVSLVKGYRFELESKPMLAGFLVIIAALFSDLNQKNWFKCWWFSAYYWHMRCFAILWPPSRLWEIDVRHFGPHNGPSVLVHHWCWNCDAHADGSNSKGQIIARRPWWLNQSTSTNPIDSQSKKT